MAYRVSDSDANLLLYTLTVLEEETEEVADGMITLCSYH
jgi:hypothetical protein